MNTSLKSGRTPALERRSTLRAIVVAALLSNALLFGLDLVSSGPNTMNVPHVLASFVFAAIAALPFRWAPLLSAVLWIGQLAEGVYFLDHMVAEIGSPVDTIAAVLFFAIPVVGLLASIAATREARAASPSVEPPTAA